MVYDFIAKMWAQKYDALVFANDHSKFDYGQGPRLPVRELDDDQNTACMITAAESK